MRNLDTSEIAALWSLYQQAETRSAFIVAAAGRVDDVPSASLAAIWDAFDHAVDMSAQPDPARNVLDEIEGVLDEQLYDNPTVKSARDNDMELPADCEHHVIIKEALREKITRVLNKRN